MTIEVLKSKVSDYGRKEIEKAEQGMKKLTKSTLSYYIGIGSPHNIYRTEYSDFKREEYVREFNKIWAANLK